MTTWVEVPSGSNTWTSSFLNNYVHAGYWLVGYTVEDGNYWNPETVSSNTWTTQG